MKRKNAAVCGNSFMGIGMVVMVAGVACAVLNQLPDFNMPALFAQGAVLAIFVGAVMWLAGARISGREQVCDWWHRHYDKRCRRDIH